jgi:phospholipid/cholesterol/gamma-HCH transport system substrate-binding protein
MKNTLETRIGLFVALIALAAVFILEIVGGAERFRPGYRFHALFNSALELKVGDRVKMAGVEVGRVEGIQLAENRVQVTMKVRRNARVKTDSIATIRFTGLLGQNFVELDFGSSQARLAENGTVLVTAEQPDLSVIMTRLEKVAIGVENLTKSFTGDKIDNLLGPFTDFLKANQEPLTATIANIRSISSQISKGKGSVGKVIYEDALYTSTLETMRSMEMAGKDAQLAIATARQVIDQVNAGKGSVGKMITDDTLYREVTASMTNLREILQKINQGQGSVGRLVNQDEFYRNAKMTLQKLDKATDSLEDQGPLSVLGIAVTHLF